MPAPRSASAALDVHARAAQDVLYPCSDGRPMADNAWQSRAILRAAGDLEVAHPDALALADILVYPEEGNPRNRIAPDVLVAFGVGTHSRSSYLVWKEGKPPDWVLEVASPSTAAKDLDFKRRAYAAMGVPEYWLFDPKGGRVSGWAAAAAGAGAVGRRVRASGAAARGRRGDDPQRRAGAGSARGRRVHPHARSGDPGGHPASERVEGPRRTGKRSVRSRRRRGARAPRHMPNGKQSMRSGRRRGARMPKPAPNGKRSVPNGRRSVRSGKQRNAWSRWLASRSWRPPFSVLKGALSGVCGLVRATTSLEILRASTVERWRSPSSPPCAPDDAHGR